MPGDSTVKFSLLYRTWKLVVLLCLLLTVVFYVRSLDIRLAFVQNQQSHNGVSQTNQGRSQATTLRPEPKTAQREQEPTEEEKELEKCPETSPLLGKSGSGPVRGLGTKLRTDLRRGGYPHYTGLEVTDSCTVD